MQSFLFRSVQAFSFQGKSALAPTLGLRAVSRWTAGGPKIAGSSALFRQKQWDLSYRKSICCRSVSYKSSYSSTKADVPLLGVTIGQLVDTAAEKFGDREAIVSCHQNIRKTYSELKLDVDKLAVGLLSLGLRKGDRIGIWSPNYYEWTLTQLASSKAGLILVNINPAYQSYELEYCLEKVGVNAIVLAESFKTQDYYKMLTTVVDTLADSQPGQVKSSRLPNLKSVIILSDKNYSGTYKFDDVLNAGGSKDQKNLENLQKRIQFDDPVNIQFTSGTTGRPKGATLSHHNLVNNAYFTGRKFGYHLEIERLSIPLPLYHCFGCVSGTIAALIHGACIVFPAPSFNAKATVEAIHKEKCTTVYGTPTMYIDILQLPDLNKYNLSSLNKGIMGGANCPIEVVKACTNQLNIKDVLTAYGCTETSPASAVSAPGGSVELLTTTVGTVLEHTEIKIIDDNGEIVPVGTSGELLVRGYTVMLGYWNEPEKTKDVITPERWYKSGDQAIMTDKGYIQIVGRIKDMIIRGGENIYPREIEEFLHEHPKIAEVQVVGVPDKRMGEEVCAWVKLKSEQNISEEEVKAFCKGKISHFKIPRYIMFIDDFPKTITGKIQKFIIREQSAKKLGLDS